MAWGYRGLRVFAPHCMAQPALHGSITASPGRPSFFGVPRIPITPGSGFTVPARRRPEASTSALLMESEKSEYHLRHVANVSWSMPATAQATPAPAPA